MLLELIFILYMWVTWFVYYLQRGQNVNDPDNRRILYFLTFINVIIMSWFFVNDFIYDTIFFAQLIIILLIVFLICVLIIVFLDKKYKETDIEKVIDKWHKKNKKICSKRPIPSKCTDFKVEWLHQNEYNCNPKLNKEIAVMTSKYLYARQFSWWYNCAILFIVAANICTCGGLVVYYLQNSGILIELIPGVPSYIFLSINTIIFNIISHSLRFFLKQVIDLYSCIVPVSVLNLINTKFSIVNLKKSLFTATWFKYMGIVLFISYTFTWLFIMSGFFKNLDYMTIIILYAIIPSCAHIIAHLVVNKNNDVYCLLFVGMNIFCSILLTKLFLSDVIIPLCAYSTYTINTPNALMTSYNALYKKLSVLNLDQNVLSNWLNNKASVLNKISNNPLFDSPVNKSYTWNPIKTFVNLLNIKANYDYIPAWAKRTAEFSNLVMYQVERTAVQESFYFTAPGDVYFQRHVFKIYGDGSHNCVHIGGGYCKTLSLMFHRYYAKNSTWYYTTEVIPQEDGVFLQKNHLNYHLKKQVLGSPKYNNINTLNNLIDHVNSNYKVNKALSYYHLGKYNGVRPVYIPFTTTIFDINYTVGNLLSISKILIKEVFPRMLLLIERPYSFNGHNAFIIDTCLKICNNYDFHMSCLYHHHKDVYIDLRNMTRPLLMYDDRVNAFELLWNDVTHGTNLLENFRRYIPMIYFGDGTTDTTMVFANYNLGRINLIYPSIIEPFHFRTGGWDIETMYGSLGLDFYDPNLTDVELYYKDYHITDTWMTIDAEILIRVLNKINVMNSQKSNAFNIYIKFMLNS